MKAIKRLTALVLALLLLAFCFVGCSSMGPKMLQLGDSKISLNLFYFYLSRMKGTYCATYGISATDDTHWSAVMDASGKTYNQYYTEFVLNEVKNLLAAVNLFEELDLKLPETTLDAIDEEIDRMIEEEANGSKAQFNQMLAEYGANISVLREAYIIEKKVEYLKDHLYGANGALIGGEMYESYYQQNYARFKHILFTTYEYVYVEDEYGDPIYYRDSSTGERYYKKTDYALDTPDKFGNTVYMTSEEKNHISYDKTNGTPMRETDKDGNYQMQPVSDSQYDKIMTDIKLTRESLTNGSYAVFDEILIDYNESAEYEEAYPNGYYVTKTSDTAWNEIRDKVFTMQVGEIAEVETKYGIHIVMRYELEESGYDLSENADFFISNATGQYNFLPSIKQYLLSEKVKPYLEEIKVVEKYYNKDGMMTTVKPNYYY